MALGVDFSKASGADGLIVTVGLPMTGAKAVQAGTQTFTVLLLGGKADEPVAAGDKVVSASRRLVTMARRLFSPRWPDHRNCRAWEFGNERRSNPQHSLA